jgi:hypothetical protein
MDSAGAVQPEKNLRELSTEPRDLTKMPVEEYDAKKLQNTYQASSKKKKWQ